MVKVTKGQAVLQRGSVTDREGRIPVNPLSDDPAPFLLAAQLAGVTADRALVIEDAESGVSAGAAGGFALVIGVDRVDAREALLAAGADVVVDDLDEVSVGGGS